MRFNVIFLGNTIKPFHLSLRSAIQLCQWLVVAVLAGLLLACNNSPGNGDSNGKSNGNSNADTSSNDPPPAQPVEPEVRTGPFNLLVYSRTAGFRHASIEAGQMMIQQLGAANNFSVDITEDPQQFNDTNLAQYEVVVFLNTTLDVLNDTQQAAFEDYIHAGGNFVGVHSAADTEHDWAFYGELVGAYFLTHPAVNQPGSLIIEDPNHPSVNHLDNPWMIQLEEYYTFESNPRDEVRVLTRIDESSYDQQPNISCQPNGDPNQQGFNGSMGDHPMTWCHDKFAGRAWYTVIGHEIYLYQTEAYRQHVLNGILTAARRVAAFCEVLPKPVGAPAYQPPMLEPCTNQVMP